MGRLTCELHETEKFIGCVSINPLKGDACQADGYNLLCSAMHTTF
jgi:hypothetical protein